MKLEVVPVKLVALYTVLMLLQFVFVQKYRGSEFLGKSDKKWPGDILSGRL